MSGDAVIELMRAGWLTLAFMMLLSRVVFQAAGPVRMRAFLDGWQDGNVKRVWGATTLTFGVILGVLAALTFQELSALDVVLLVGLLAILVTDGLVNVLPDGFMTFKRSVQEAWVTRHRGTESASDRHLFGTVNALLALAAAVAAVVVIVYRPIEARTVIAAGVIAVTLTISLVWASEQSRRAPETRV